jgi:hypothetical protein
MKNFKLNATRLPRKTKTGKRIYKLSGSNQSLTFYRKMQGEYLRVDDDGISPLFFTSTLAQAGTITFNEENERFYLEPDFASEVMIEAAMRMFKIADPISSAPKTTDDQDDDQEEAEIEVSKATKPKTTKRSLKDVN